MCPWVVESLVPKFPHKSEVAGGSWGQLWVKMEGGWECWISVFLLILSQLVILTT